MDILNIAQATFGATETDSLLTAMIGLTGDVLTTGLAIVFALVGVLIGLMFILKLVRRYVGASK